MEDEGFPFPSDVETIVIAASWPLRHFTELPRHKYPGIQHGAQSPTESHGIETDGDLFIANYIAPIHICN